MPNSYAEGQHGQVGPVSLPLDVMRVPVPADEGREVGGRCLSGVRVLAGVLDDHFGDDELVDDYQREKEKDFVSVEAKLRFFFTLSLGTLYILSHEEYMMDSYRKESNHRNLVFRVGSAGFRPSSTLRPSSFLR